MIVYDPETRTFLLEGDAFSYLVSVSEAGYLSGVHFGGKISRGDLPALARWSEERAPSNGDLNGGMRFDRMPSEYAFYARGDFREPTAVIERAAGDAMSVFRYRSHRIRKGAPVLEGLPHAREGGETLEIVLSDDFSAAEIRLFYLVAGNVLVRHAEIVNAGEEDLWLKRAFSFSFELPARDYRLLRLEGRWAAERTPDVTPIGHGIVRLQSLRGASSHQMNPFLALLSDDCTEDGGECWGVQLVYSGSFALTAEMSETGCVRVQGGVNDFGFRWKLAKGEKFVCPQAALCYSAEGLGGLSRAYHDFLRTFVMPPKFARSPRPVVANNWEGTYFDFDRERLFAIIDGAKELGADAFVLDDGWFGKRNSDASSLGDWFVNTRKLEGGLKPLIERCKSHGMRFGVWIEPEMISEDSELFRAHPDYALMKAGTEPVRGRNQLVLDFTRKEVVDAVFAQIFALLSENEISYVKWDMNRSLTEYYSEYTPAGEVMHRYCLGVYALAERLTSAFPNVLFEGCSGGGGRFDAGMLYYFPQIWTSDNTDGYERARIQWGTSLCYPLSAMSCHVSACPNHQTGRTTPLMTRALVASLGATGFELDPAKLQKEERERLKAFTEEYRAVQDLVLCGDLFRLSDPFRTDRFCMLAVAKDKGSAYLVCEQLRGIPNECDRLLRLKGLDEKGRYHVAELGVDLSGEALMNVGIPLPKCADYDSFCLHLVRQPQP